MLPTVELGRELLAAAAAGDSKLVGNLPARGIPNARRELRYPNMPKPPGCLRPLNRHGLASRARPSTPQMLCGWRNGAANITLRVRGVRRVGAGLIQSHPSDAGREHRAGLNGRTGRRSRQAERARGAGDEREASRILWELPGNPISFFEKWDSLSRIRWPIAHSGAPELRRSPTLLDSGVPRVATFWRG
jgi:hypothetical protein